VRTSPDRSEGDTYIWTQAARSIEKVSFRPRRTEETPDETLFLAILIRNGERPMRIRIGLVGSHRGKSRRARYFAGA
jgi:hypothetical protein